MTKVSNHFKTSLLSLEQLLGTTLCPVTPVFSLLVRRFVVAPSWIISSSVQTKFETLELTVETIHLTKTKDFALDPLISAL